VALLLLLVAAVAAEVAVLLLRQVRLINSRKKAFQYKNIAVAHFFGEPPLSFFKGLLEAIY
jgi:hypothetical protein